MLGFDSSGETQRISSLHVDMRTLKGVCAGGMALSGESGCQGDHHQGVKTGLGTLPFLMYFN